MTLEPEIILPHVEPATRLTGEMRLLLALLEEASATYLRRTGATLQEMRATARWFWSESYTLTSFRFVCDVFGIDHRDYRRRLVVMRREKVKRCL